jgi:DNA (cytosine-5)-methyltransferase 1
VGGGRVQEQPDGADRGFPGRHYWETEPDVDRVVNGIPDRVERIKCLGNAVVPQQFYPFFKAIAEIESGGD